MSFEEMRFCDHHFIAIDVFIDGNVERMICQKVCTCRVQKACHIGVVVLLVATTPMLSYATVVPVPTVVNPIKVRRQTAGAIQWPIHPPTVCGHSMMASNNAVLRLCCKICCLVIFWAASLPKLVLSSKPNIKRKNRGKEIAPRRMTWY